MFQSLGDVYKKKVLFKESGAVEDTKNSYNTTASMMGPGHGPYNAGQNDIAGNDNTFKFPEEENMSLIRKKELLLNFLKRELDENEEKEFPDKWSESEISIFEQLYGDLLSTQEEDSASSEHSKLHQDVVRREQDLDRK
jgi:hypothetical protein